MLCFGLCVQASQVEETVPPMPKFYLNNQPATVTIQDLSGLVTRPLRVLVRRNNQLRGEEWIQVYALGARVGENLRMEMSVPSPGLRMTLYRILHEESGDRYLTMPVSTYFDVPRATAYKEKIQPFREEFFIVVFEKTDSPNEKNVNVRYFEERVRHLVIDSIKTNFLFSALKFKMKDYFASAKAGEFFERDVQSLMDRFIKPRRIYLIRVWKASA